MSLELDFSDSKQMHKPVMCRMGLGRCLMLTRVHLGVLLTSLSYKACIYIFVHLILQRKVQCLALSLRFFIWRRSLIQQWSVCALFAGSGIPDTCPHQLDSFICCLEWKDLPAKNTERQIFVWGLFYEMSQGLEWGLKWTITSRYMWESSLLRCSQDPRHPGKGSPAYRAGRDVDEENNLVCGPKWAPDTQTAEPSPQVSLQLLSWKQTSNNLLLIHHSKRWG